MSLELFEKALRQVAPLTDQVCFHLMGDPLLHPRLREMVELCHHYKTHIFFVTNGVLLKESQAQLLLHPAFRQVNFSLHSFSDNFPQKDPSLYLQRIFDYCDKAFLLRPDLYINFRLWNLQDPKSSGPQNQDFLNRICHHFQVPLPSFVDVRKQKSVRLKNRLYLHFDTEFVWPAMDLPILGTHGTCYGLTSHFGILADGTVVPCCLDKEGRIPLGTIAEQPLLEILEAPRAQAILQGFRQRQLKEGLCQRCPYISRFKKALALTQPNIKTRATTSLSRE